MSHYAKIENNIVTQVLISDYETFIDSMEGEWVKTAYDSPVGELPFDATARKNFAKVGYTYDRGSDEFIPPQPYPSWVVDADTCTWVNPAAAAPDDGGLYTWDEPTASWVVISA